MGRRTVRIAVDANLLLRFIIGDDPEQQAIAADELRRADGVVLPLVALCEFAWVLKRSYRVSRSDIALALRELMGIQRTVCDTAAVEAGLELMENGGDFADGVIAYLGRYQGADRFVTFDQDAVKRLETLGHPARLAVSNPS